MSVLILVPTFLIAILQPCNDSRCALSAIMTAICYNWSVIINWHKRVIAQKPNYEAVNYDDRTKLQEICSIASELVNERGVFNKEGFCNVLPTTQPTGKTKKCQHDKSWEPVWLWLWHAYVDPGDMLNNFCFHVYAQKSPFIGENGNHHHQQQHLLLWHLSSLSWFPAKK